MTEGAPGDRPLIALSRSSTPADYAESIRQAGGEPLLVDASSGSIADVLDRVTGVVLAGGADVDPERYGESRHPATEDAEPGRDAFELDLVRGALAADLPVLAICRGLQVLNVALGGTLVQDIPTEVATSLAHDIRRPRDAKAHLVQVKTGSKLLDILRERVDADNQLPVNSRHHQAIAKIGNGLHITATAPDGIIEAAERPDVTFCLGVQWHPENFVRSSGMFRPLFDAFMDACRAKRRGSG